MLLLMAFVVFVVPFKLLIVPPVVKKRVPDPLTVLLEEFAAKVML